jgi:hypothetical protein
MSISIHVKSSDPTAAEDRRQAIDAVIAQFGDKLPELRMLCFFDDEDGELLKRNFGRANRGFYTPLKGSSRRIAGWHLYPWYVQECILVEDSSRLLLQAADHLIYLHGATCMNRTSLIMTFAHELQHFVQYGTSRDLWAASTVLMNLEKDFYKNTCLKVFHIPTELEARIVAKKVAETICGMEAMDGYIKSRISEAVTPDDKEDWQFVRDLAADHSFDLLAQSKQVFQRLSPYRASIEQALARARDDDDFRNLDLSFLMNG